MTHNITILSHRGLDFSEKDHPLENSYEALEKRLREGYGLEIDLQFSKDGEIFLSHDESLDQISKGAYPNKISEYSTSELRNISINGDHLTTLTELLTLYKFLEEASIAKGLIAIHIKHTIQNRGHMDAILQTIKKSFVSFSSILLFDLKPEIARYLKNKEPRLQIAASLSHRYDVERFGELTGGTLLSLEEVLDNKEIYTWAWLDEWDKVSKTGTKALYTKEIFEVLRRNNIKIAVISPELHSNLQFKEMDVKDKDKHHLLKEIKEIVKLSPDAICTDFPKDTTHIIGGSRTRNKIAAYRSAVKSRLFKYGLAFLEKKFNRFFTYHSRPKKAADFKTMPFELTSSPRTAIILQGPIARAENFTLETVKMYKKNFPETSIIVSTWEDENMSDIDALAAAGANVVRNKKPPFAGPSNVNFQLASTQGGIIEAKSLGATHIIKSRTDQRLYGTNLMPFLANIVKKFPVAPGFKQKQRIVLSSFGVCKYAPYYFSDLFMFGHIDDMTSYWNIPFVEKGVKKEFFNPEIHLATWFLEKTGRRLTWTIEDSWKAYAEQTIIVDHTTLDLYWLKYDRWLADRRRNYSERPELLSGALSFHEWFILYSDLENIKPLDRPVFFRGLSIK